MRVTCVKCLTRFVVDEMATEDAARCPACGTVAAASARRVGEPPTPPPPPPVRAPVRAAVPAPAVARTAAPRPAGPVALPVAAPLRGCPACGAKMALDARACPSCGADYRRALRIARGEKDDDAPFRLESQMMDAGVWGGLGLIVLAAVWFFLGLQAHRIFFYPPILAVVGLVAIVNGIGARRAKARRGQPRGRYR